MRRILMSKKNEFKLNNIKIANGRQGIKMFGFLFKKKDNTTNKESVIVDTKLKIMLKV